VWIVYGDHGEAFGQHDGNFAHTFFLYEENVHVPLIVAEPGVIAEEIRARKVVSLVDLAPTLLDLAGEAVPALYRGRSMLDGVPRAAVFFTDYSLKLAGVRDGRWKWIGEIGSGRGKLFDLDVDAAEKHDAAAGHPELADRYRRLTVAAGY
jgi:arylsulfatase A-like enzyme